MSTLGPHIVQYIMQSGETGAIILNITLDGDKEISLGDGDSVIQKTGSVHISSSFVDKSIPLQAENDIQLVMWLMITSDIYVRKLCTDNNIEIFRYETGDIAASGSIYKP